MAEASREVCSVKESSPPNTVDMTHPIRSVSSRPTVTQNSIPPVCNVYFLFFFSGLFISPLLLIGGMFGVYSDKPYEFWAGKASAIACMVYTVVFVIAGSIIPLLGNGTTTFEI